MGSANNLLLPNVAESRCCPHGDLPLGLEMGHGQGGGEELVEEVPCPVNLPAEGLNPAYLLISTMQGLREWGFAPSCPKSR